MGQWTFFPVGHRLVRNLRCKFDDDFGPAPLLYHGRIGVHATRQRVLTEDRRGAPGGRAPGLTLGIEVAHAKQVLEQYELDYLTRVAPLQESSGPSILSPQLFHLRAMYRLLFRRDVAKTRG